MFLSGINRDKSSSIPVDLSNRDVVLKFAVLGCLDNQIIPGVSDTQAVFICH